MGKPKGHFGVYGLVFNNDKSEILLIEKVAGPYTGLLDLPGGTPDFGEKTEETLIREIEEETGIKVLESNLLDICTATHSWIHHGEPENCYHIGAIYEVTKYDGKAISEVEVTSQNDDSKGAKFYKLSELSYESLSSIAISTFEQFGLLEKGKVITK